ncbi:hypothetical protein IQ07DRAFT_650959 [Pyrenochaeta sp. DS3sAY3a]|nr:hypothetical protein IQ07DRAFT_650959 [Pyrenochaeta sp. DS3sAY3a]
MTSPMEPSHHNTAEWALPHTWTQYAAHDQGRPASVCPAVGSGDAGTKSIVASAWGRRCEQEVDGWRALHWTCNRPCLCQCLERSGMRRWPSERKPPSHVRGSTSHRATHASRALRAAHCTPPCLQRRSGSRGPESRLSANGKTEGCANYFVQAVVASSGYNPQAALELHPALALAVLVLDPPPAALPTHSSPPPTPRPTLGSTFSPSRAVGCAFRALTPSRKLPSPHPPCILRPHPGRLLTTEDVGPPRSKPGGLPSVLPKLPRSPRTRSHQPSLPFSAFYSSAAQRFSRLRGLPLACLESSEYTSHPFPALRLRSAAYHCCFGTVTTLDQD